MAGLIIGVAAKKGGCGKTTISMNLAGALSKLLKKVLVVDADPQGTTLTWRAAAGKEQFPLQVVGIPRAVLHQEVPRLAQDYAAVVIDSPSGYQDETIQRSVMMASDLVIIPVEPSAVDLWSARDTVKLVADARLVNAQLIAMLLISRAQVNTRLASQAKEALEGLSLPLFSTVISQRIALAECPLYGKLILHYPNHPAAKEFRTLAREILTVMHYGEKST